MARSGDADFNGFKNGQSFNEFTDAAIFSNNTTTRTHNTTACVCFNFWTIRTVFVVEKFEYGGLYVPLEFLLKCLIDYFQRMLRFNTRLRFSSWTRVFFLRWQAFIELKRCYYGLYFFLVLHMYNIHFFVDRQSNRSITRIWPRSYMSESIAHNKLWPF